MATRGDWLLIAGLVFCSSALLFLVIGFSTPHWLELDTDYTTISGIEKIGLWEACFHNYAFYKDYTGKIYNGCWLISSDEYRPILSYIRPPWFLGIQVMMSITLLMEIAAVLLIILILFIIKCYPGKDRVLPLFFVGVMGILPAVSTAVCMVIFSVKSLQTVVDNQWIVNPGKNFLSWSFWCVVCSGFFVLFGGMCVIVSALQMKLAIQYNNRAKPCAGYDARHQPPIYYLSETQINCQQII